MARYLLMLRLWTRNRRAADPDAQFRKVVVEWALALTDFDQWRETPGVQEILGVQDVPGVQEMPDVQELHDLQDGHDRR